MLNNRLLYKVPSVQREGVICVGKKLDEQAVALSCDENEKSSANFIQACKALYQAKCRLGGERGEALDFTK